MSTPPPDDASNQDTEIDLLSENVAAKVDLDAAPAAEMQASASDDMFFSTMNELPPTKKAAEVVETENMDDIFRANTPKDIKLTDDEDDEPAFFGSAPSKNNSDMPSSPVPSKTASSINIKPMLSRESSTSPNLSPPGMSSFKNKLESASDEEEEDVDKDKFLTITISDPKKVGDGMGSYVEYTIHIRTNYPAFKSTEFTMKRRFSDFLSLYEKLKEKHLIHGYFLPPMPEKDMIGMARVKMSKEDTTPIDFIEKRRAAMERFLNRIAKHKQLKFDPDFRDFLEVADGITKTNNTSALSSAGMFKMFNNVKESVSKIAIKMEETDQWFEEKSHQIDVLHLQYKKMHSIVEMLYGYRKDLVISTRDFSKCTAILSNSEEQLSLSRALSQLGENYEKIEQLHLDQSNVDYFTFVELLKDYVCLYENIKEVFHQRVKCYVDWQRAEHTLKAKEEHRIKLETSKKLDKVPAAAAEIEEWTHKVEKSKEEFELISKSIKEEMKRFDVNRAKEFKVELTKYLQSLLANQEALVKIWEQYLPQVKAI